MAAISLAVSACGDGDTGAPAVELGGPAINTSVQLADCTDWEQANVDERLGTIAQLENFAGGPSGGGGRGAVLSDEDAYDVMESFCGEEYARGFRLYKLYTRAAAFSGQ